MYELRVRLQRINYRLLYFFHANTAAVVCHGGPGTIMLCVSLGKRPIVIPRMATRGEHVAFGDTGVVIYSNSVCGARSNFEGGPSALSAGLTGRSLT